MDSVRDDGSLRYELRHNLQGILRLFERVRHRKDLEKIPEYLAHRTEIERVAHGIAYDFSLSIQRKVNRALRIVHWNIETGHQLDAVIQCLKHHPYLSCADVLILTESDIGMARSGNRHVAHEVAHALAYQYVYVNNYLFISKGTRHEIPGENEWGLHGVALLSRLPIRRWQVLDFPSWLDKIPGYEKCFGRRRGVVAVLDIGAGREVAVAGIHIEAHSSPSQRARQMRAVLKGIADFVSPETPVAIGGDLNTTTYSTFNGQGFVPNVIRHLVRGVRKSVEFDYLYPDVSYEKLFREVLSHGYSYHAWNELGKETFMFFPFEPAEREKVVHRLPRFLIRYLDKKLARYAHGIGMKLDWFMGRGLRVLENREVVENGYASEKPQVIQDIQTGEVRLSDHFPIGVDVAL